MAYATEWGNDLQNLINFSIADNKPPFRRKFSQESPVFTISNKLENLCPPPTKKVYFWAVSPRSQLFVKIDYPSCFVVSSYRHLPLKYLFDFPPIFCIGHSWDNSGSKITLGWGVAMVDKIRSNFIRFNWTYSTPLMPPFLPSNCEKDSKFYQIGNPSTTLLRLEILANWKPIFLIATKDSNLLLSLKRK